MVFILSTVFYNKNFYFLNFSVLFMSALISLFVHRTEISESRDSGETLGSRMLHGQMLSQDVPK